MRKLIVLFFTIAFLGCNLSVKAQVKIEKSTNIVQDVNGNNYYLHHVLKGQTLYALSKYYGVKVSDIVDANADIENGLKVGQDIKIPKIDVPVQAVKVDIPVAPQGFVYHQVKKGETLFRIMYNYQVSLQELKKYNSGLTSNIQPGQWILIPNAETRKAILAMSKYDSIVTYKLRRRDNYYRLEKKFKINQKQLEQLNPNLRTTGLQKDIVIKVPYVHSKFKSPEYSEIVLDSVKPEPIYNRSMDSNWLDCMAMKHNNHVYKIGFMIPLFENLDKDIVVDNDYKIKKQTTYKSFRFIQFVQGAMLALDSLQKLGLKAEVYFWDTRANVHITDSICKLPEFKQLDLLIGPFYSKNVAVVRAAADTNRTIMIDIFGDSYSKKEKNSKYFYMKASLQNNYNALVKYISDSIPSYRISIIYQSKADEINRFDKLSKSLHSKFLNIDTNMIFMYNYNDNGVNKILNSLSTDKTNIIFNLVDDEAKISNFLRQLNFKKKDNNVMVMAQEEVWSKYKTLELTYLSNLHYTFSSDYYICNTDSNNVIPFQYKFYNKYKRMPEKYAFLSYDISWYFGNALLYYGSNFTSCLPRFRFSTMHKKFFFKPVVEGVFINNEVNVLQYDNYHKLKKNI